MALARRSGKLLKRLLVGLAIVVTVVVLVSSAGLIMLRRTPQWYRLPQMTAQEREAAAQRATNKLAMLQNRAAELRIEERRRPATTGPATVPAGRRGISISFTDRELNAFFDKWAAWNNWKGAYERYVTDPVIVLRDRRLILAARVHELNTVASLHFEPRIDDQGRLHLELVRVLGGNLPLPERILGDYRERLIGSMRRNLPQWRRSARMDPSGTPNSSAVAAAMGELLVQILNRQPAEPVLFLPVLDDGAVAVKLVDVAVEAHTLTLTVEPLTRQERGDLLARVRADGSGSAASD